MAINAGRIVLDWARNGESTVTVLDRYDDSAGNTVMANFLIPRYTNEHRAAYDPANRKFDAETHHVLQRLFTCRAVLWVDNEETHGFRVFLSRPTPERDLAEAIRCMTPMRSRS